MWFNARCVQVLTTAKQRVQMLDAAKAVGNAAAQISIHQKEPITFLGIPASRTLLNSLGAAIASGVAVSVRYATQFVVEKLK